MEDKNLYHRMKRAQGWSMARGVTCAHACQQPHLPGEHAILSGSLHQIHHYLHHAKAEMPIEISCRSGWSIDYTLRARVQSGGRSPQPNGLLGYERSI